MEANLIDRACQYAVEDGQQLRGTDAITDYLLSSKYIDSEFMDKHQASAEKLHQIAFDLSYLLGAFKSDGYYGKFFTGPTTFNIKDDEFVCTDLEKLRSVILSNDCKLNERNNDGSLSVRSFTAKSYFGRRSRLYVAKNRFCYYGWPDSNDK